MRIVKSKEEASEISCNSGSQFQAWIQWKGTDVCLDLRCECGEITHLDADFAYFVRCCLCKRVYMLNPNIEIVRVEDFNPEQYYPVVKETTTD